MNAIETVYRGYRFRSRLEARWAAFFDSLHWEWEYEPIDLDGYIPDFILKFPRPVLAEVKPACTVQELREHTDKIDQSGWQHEAILVGSSLDLPTGPGCNKWDSPCWFQGHAIGLYRQGPFEGDAANPEWDWGPGLFISHQCSSSSTVSVTHNTQMYHCFKCWGQPWGGGPPVMDDDEFSSSVLRGWAASANAVQWRR